MGRIKTKLVKRITHELMNRHGEKLTSEFEANKHVVNELVSCPSKKLRNIIAGYAARLKKAED